MQKYIDFCVIPKAIISWQLLTIGNDCQVPVDKHYNDKKFTLVPDSLCGVKGQIFKYRNN